jgi:hypothetical protein
MVGSQVTNEGARVGGDLDLSVNRRGAGLATPHASVLKDVPSVLVLVKEEVVGSMLHWGAEEVVERVDVIHGEVLLEKLQTWGSEDDVVDVEQQVSNVGTATVDEQRGVRLGTKWKAKQ